MTCDAHFLRSSFNSSNLSDLFKNTLFLNVSPLENENNILERALDRWTEQKE